MAVKRFGVSLEEDLLEKLDHLVIKHNFPNRSQAIRFLINRHVVEEKWKEDEDVAGALVLIYDHHKRDLQNQLTSLQHDYNWLILSSQHVHLDHLTCLETITLRGRSNKLLRFVDKLRSIKGIKHSDLVMSAT